MTRWQQLARSNTQLSIRCPLCAPAWAELHHLEIEVSRVHIAGEPDPVLQGPLAEALDTSMREEGILVDQRLRVLRRLYRMSQDTDPVRSYGYIAALLRSTAEVQA